MIEPIDFQIGMIVALYKKHPCGSFEWKVDRIGADIRIICTQCGRKLLFPRSELEKKVKKCSFNSKS